jgi:CubicO group peptidase (beta-lactamase class C family)
MDFHWLNPMKIALTGLLGLAMAATPAAAPQPTGAPAPHLGQNNVRALLEPIRVKYKVPCLAAMTLQGSKIIAEGIVGVRKSGAPDLATLDDQFHLGSDTKAMTATLIASLIEDGKLKWSTTVGDVFGAAYPKMDPAWKTVTLAQLLTHRGGAPANLDAGGLWGRLSQRQGTPQAQRLQLVEGVVTAPPAAPPGTQYIYSNAGFSIAGAMAEKVTGESYEDLMQERVFKPLGITSAGFGAPGTRGKIDEPWGHTADGKPVEPGPNADNPEAITPAGRAHMTLADWSKFIALHLLGDAANPHRQVTLLKPMSFNILHAPAAGPGESYACGWLVTTRNWASGGGPGNSGVTLTHAGSNTMWFCVVWIAPERNLAFIAATNQGGDAAGTACDQAIATMIQLAGR